MQVSSLWNEASNHQMVWETLCNRLWYDKCYVPHSIRKQKEENAKLAYKLSLEDSQRTYIYKEELCGLVWNFRFKEDAGRHWTSSDPWWQGKTPPCIKFTPDGGMKISDGGDCSMNESIASSFENRRWRFVETVAGLTGPPGSFVQVNHFPAYIVSRFKNWGFIMQSCWVIYTSFPLPPISTCPQLEDANLKVTTQLMKKEVVIYNLGVQHFHNPNINPAQVAQIFQILANVGWPDVDDFFPNYEDNEDNDAAENNNVDDDAFEE